MGDEVTRLVVFDSDAVAARAAGRLLSDGEQMVVVATVSTEAETTQAVAEHRPDVVLVAGDADLARRIAQGNACAVVLASQDVSEEAWRAARAGGVRAMCGYPADYAEVRQAVEAIAAEERRVAALAGARTRRVMVASAPEAEAAKALGRAIAVFGTKGGLGKSTIAANLAVVLASRGLRVVAVDWDLASPDLATLYGVSADRTLADWAALPEGEDLDGERIESLLTRHRTGVWLLPAPPDPMQAGGIDAAILTRVLTALQSFADVILLDLPTADLTSDAVATGLRQADDVLYVVSPDRAAVAEAGHTLRALRQLSERDESVDLERWRLVISRAPRTGGLPISEFASRLGLRPIGSPLPDDPDVRSATNWLDGQMPIERLRGSGWAALMRDLARDLVPEAPPAPQVVAERPRRRGLLGWLAR